MTDLTLHNHTDIGWVSWRVGRNFGAIHLERQGSGKTLCDVAIPNVGRVVRDQYSAAIEMLCKSCLRTFSQEKR